MNKSLAGLPLMFHGDFMDANISEIIKHVVERDACLFDLVHLHAILHHQEIYLTVLKISRITSLLVKNITTLIKHISFQTDFKNYTDCGNYTNFSFLFILKLKILK